MPCANLSLTKSLLLMTLLHVNKWTTTGRGTPSNSWFLSLYVLTHKPLIHFKKQRSPQKKKFCFFFLTFYPNVAPARCFPCLGSHIRDVFTDLKSNVKHSFKNFLFEIMLELQKNCKVNTRRGCHSSSPVGTILHIRAHLSKLRNEHWLSPTNWTRFMDSSSFPADILGRDPFRDKILHKPVNSNISVVYLSKIINLEINKQF